MEELIKFLKEQNLYSEDFFKFIEGKVKVISCDSSVDWFGCYPLTENNILNDIRILVPEIKTEKSFLVNLNVYIQALEMFNQLGKKYKNNREQSKKIAENYEKIYIEEKSSNINKEENVTNYYVICNRLKNIIRTGWKDWNVKRDRLESVAEHIYGVQMLALAMKSEYKYDIDIMKVILMLAVHELGETVIGDLTQFQISKEEKEKIERESVSKILKGLLDGREIENLFLEFDLCETKEAKFAYQCDKLECDLQSKLYGEENCVDLNDQENNNAIDNPIVKKLLDSGESWETMWLKFGQEIYPYDENFKAVSNYAIKNNISKKKEKSI